MPLVPAGALATAQQARDEDERLLMWRLSVVSFVIGALTALSVVVAPDPDPSDHTAIAVIAGVLVLSSAALALSGPRGRLVALTPLWGVLCVSALVVVARPLGAMPLFYLWPLLQAAYFLDRRPMIAVEATMLVSYAVALQWSPPGQRIAYFVAVVVCTLMVAVVVGHLQRRVARLVARLDTAASTDPLTGLLNRRAFEAEFDRELVRADRYLRPLTLAVFDLDHFKGVNDEFGHARGDQALRRVAEILDSDRRGSDVVARLGGEEFAILFADTGQAEAHRAVVRIAELLGDDRPDDGVRLSVSAGLAESDGGLLERADLMRAADAALYAAKVAGRRRVVSHGGQTTVVGSFSSEPWPAPEPDAQLAP